MANDPERTAICVATILCETGWLDLMVDRVLIWRTSSKDRLPFHLEGRPVAQTADRAIERLRGMIAPR